MPLYAIADLDDTLAATKALLWPVDVARWVKLAVVVFFVGVPGTNVFQHNVAGGESVPASGGTLPTIGPRLLALLLLLVVIGVVLAGIYLLVGSIMEFVLVDSLRTETVTLRAHWARRWRMGVRLFGFRIGLVVLAVGTVGTSLALVIGPALFGQPAISLLLGIVLVPVALALAIGLALLNGFTTAFVVPVTIVEDCGIIAGWRAFWPTCRRDWRQYGAYVLVSFVLSIGAGVLLGIILAGVGLVLAIPVLLAAVVGIVTLGSIGFVVVAVGGIAVLLVLLAVAAIVMVPIKTYLRYFSLFVLGDTNDRFDVIEERRSAVRQATDAT